ncbi:MAG: damage-inducible protein DinB [Treponema sp.]|nr:damage-inducible protein DinB [Treponema sp.]
MNDAEMYARYNQEANKALMRILDGLSNDEREMDRGSYFGSLSELARHGMSGTCFLLGILKEALAENAAAAEALAGLPAWPEKGPLDEAGWKKLGRDLAAADAAYVGMARALGDGDLRLPIKIDWNGGNPRRKRRPESAAPESVPLSFMLGQLTVHGAHHRGQISQILDEMKIEHDFSGMGIALKSPAGATPCRSMKASARSRLSLG